MKKVKITFKVVIMESPTELDEEENNRDAIKKAVEHLKNIVNLPIEKVGEHLKIEIK